MSNKRPIDSFFVKNSKKLRTSEASAEPTRESKHPTYPFPILEFSESIQPELLCLPAKPGRVMNNQPDLDMIYFEPYIPPRLATTVFGFLRSHLPFYRVEYDIMRGGIETHIHTPRYTTVFGVDETSSFDGDGLLVDAKTGKRQPADAYPKCQPRPIPKCLDDLRRAAEAATSCTFNFCLVNYYASGADSISFHSDDERFLGAEPAIASLSLGARRDFLMKHKPVPPPAPSEPAASGPVTFTQIRLPLASGDMVLMKGPTQASWLHSIPKRTGKNEQDGGRINVTFRRALVKGGTANYYHYNVGSGPVYKWDATAREMKIWES